MELGMTYGLEFSSSLFTSQSCYRVSGWTKGEERKREIKRDNRERVNKKREEGSQEEERVRNREERRREKCREEKTCIPSGANFYPITPWSLWNMDRNYHHQSLSLSLQGVEIDIERGEGERRWERVSREREGEKERKRTGATPSGAHFSPITSWFVLNMDRNCRHPSHSLPYRVS